MNLTQVLRSEIQRQAKRIARLEVEVLRKLVAGQRKSIASLRKELDALRASMRAASRSARAAAATPKAAPNDWRGKPRFSPKTLTLHRERLQLTTADFCKLIGVSTHTFYAYVRGEHRPSGSVLAAIARVRRMSAKDARRAVDAL